MTYSILWRPVFPSIAIVVLLITAVGPAQSQTIDRSKLADLALEYEEIKAVVSRPGGQLLMRLDTLPGDRFSLHLPFGPDRVEWLLGDGSQVERGQDIARVYGPELEHWLLDVEMLQERFAQAESRYAQNKLIFQQQGISAETWQSIVAYYHRLRLEHQHMSHVLEWLHADPSMDDADRAVLRAPKSGLLLLLPGVADELPIAEIVETRSLRLTAKIPQTLTSSVVALRVANCQLPLARQDNRVAGFSLTLWSEPSFACLPPRPGMTVTGVPVYQFNGYAVPRDAILGFEGRTYIALESPDGLELAAVDIVGEDAALFYLTSDRSLDGTRALVRSTSAIQGLLLGLGDD